MERWSAGYDSAVFAIDKAAVGGGKWRVGGGEVSARIVGGDGNNRFRHGKKVRCAGRQMVAVADLTDGNGCCSGAGDMNQIGIGDGCHRRVVAAVNERQIAVDGCSRTKVGCAVCSG